MDRSADRADRPREMLFGGLGVTGIQGYLAHKKTPTPLGPPQDPRHRPTLGSYGGAFSCAVGALIAQDLGLQPGVG